MENKYRLIIAYNTAQMLLVDKVLRTAGIQTELVPAPPETGTVCAIAVKIDLSELENSSETLKQNDIKVKDIIEEKKLKLQGLIDEKLGRAVTAEFINILRKIENGDGLNKDEIVYLLSTQKPREIEAIYTAADRIRKEMVGDVVEIRGAIEFSNYCCKSCNYCGINAKNHGASRYRMNEDEIMEVVHDLYKVGIKTVILQSGEDAQWTTERLIELIKRIKRETGMRVTLSVGEKRREEYEALREAGGNNFLLKIETTNRELFKEIHPDDDYDHRIQCSKWLKELGYINGSGNIIGLPGQTVEDIAVDILYFKEMGINMIGIGPFIPAKGTKYENHPHGGIEETLRAVAVTRIVCKKVYIPSTTALASLDKDAQVMALQCGANTIMLISTPEEYRRSYRIYDNKNMVDMEAAVYAVTKAGRKMPEYIKIMKKEERRMKNDE
ncbi:MAG: [FeFe] hydrogenase H-cluster radical SAM maturase HydE [Clostridia bacterium]|nr:[FeFe] hydrogenase H-cluster radical SAM maturase HydE [Clostridia bacterium]